MTEMLGSAVGIEDYAGKIKDKDKYGDVYFYFALKIENKSCKEISKSHEHKRTDNNWEVW